MINNVPLLNQRNPNTISRNSSESSVCANNRAGVFSFSVDGRVNLPAHTLNMSVSQTNRPTNPTRDEGFNQALMKFWRRFDDRDIRGVVGIGESLGIYAANYGTPEVQRHAIQTLSLKHHTLSAGQNLRSDDHLANTRIDFGLLARVYYSRGTSDYSAGLAAAHLLEPKNFVAFGRSVTSRIGEHKPAIKKAVSPSPSGGFETTERRGFELHEFSKGLLFSGEPTAVAVAMNQIAQSIGRHYDSPKIIAWTLWQVLSPMSSDITYVHHCLAYHLCKEQPTWPINIPRILESVISYPEVSTPLQYLSRWRDRQRIEGGVDTTPQHVRMD